MTSSSSDPAAIAEHKVQIGIREKKPGHNTPETSFVLVFDMFVYPRVLCIDFRKGVGMFPSFCGTTLLYVSEAIDRNIFMDSGPVQR